MDDLPCKLFKMIFSYLGLKDQVKCRRVNKNWKSRIDHDQFLNDYLKKVKCLVVSGVFNPILIHYKWFDNNEFVSMQVYIEKSKLDSFLNFVKLTNQVLSNNLRELVIRQLNSSIANKLLIMFNQIERLLVFSFKRDRKEDLVMNLPNLVVLSISGDLDKVTFILPKLNKLYLDVYQTSKLSFLYPLTIEYAHFEFYNDCLEQFHNLKVLICDDMFSSEDLKDDFLLNFKSINEIHTIDGYIKLIA